MISYPANGNRRTPLLVTGLLMASVAVQAQTPRTKDRDPLAGFDLYVTDAMKQWKVPGLAIAAVRGDSIVFAKGYGVKTLGNPAPVDAQTLFAIGSASKAFTGAALEMLSDEGKISFDGRVTDYLPWFEMSDPWVTREIRVRDLLLHRSGLERGDNVWYGTTRSREEIVRSVRRLAPSSSFRTHFQYQNLMYITAGEVVHQVTGQSWDDVIKARIFGPLGMNQSNTSVRDLAGLPNVATPHAELGGVVKTIPWRNIDNAAAAGSINSNVADMAKWLRLWINRGSFQGQRIVSESMVREATTPQFTVDDPQMIARLMSPAFLGYGFGWFVQDFRGRRLVNHGGNIDGMAAMVTFLPDEKLGVVILTNMNQSDITLPLVAHLYDRLLGISPAKDYNTEYLAAKKAFEAKQAASTKPPIRVAGTKPSLPLEAYVGVYRDSFLGTATVTLGSNGALSIRYDASPGAVGELEHWHFDSFVATMKDPILGKIPINFRLGPNGQVSGLVFGLAGPQEWAKDQ
jgi:CubicO group peptidase (beta-lactamase class C family)